ncbi:MAG: hypothetical protein KBB01_06770 [Candidatus Omnitrophica bacterium]|jgi:transcriptional regulator of heat shock response|nr:hypothetical protein [Candidatus Omnitrophota bacterium]
MVKFVEAKERERGILKIIVDSYINETKPISSSYLCEKYRLNYSPATVRNIMMSLENQGFLSHVHTSSGRIPTQSGFRYYVDHLNDEDAYQSYPVTLNFYAPTVLNIEEITDYLLDSLVKLSGYTSLVAVSGRDEKLFFKGVRFILDQPEFEDVHKLRDILYTLEEKMDQLGEILFRCVDEKISILIGEDIGFSEISDCSLVISGLKDKNITLAMALLGPMRMNYLKAKSCIHSTREQLSKMVKAFI